MTISGRSRATNDTLDLGARQAILGNGELLLTSREFDLLAFLLTNPNQVFSRKDLLASVWR